MFFPVTVRDDGSILVMARAEGPNGIIGDAAFALRPGDDGYDAALKELTDHTAE